MAFLECAGVHEEEVDLGFASLGASDAAIDGAKRLFPAPAADAESDGLANSSRRLVELGGIEPPTLRLPA